jgi:hypothetical protein
VLSARDSSERVLIFDSFVAHGAYIGSPVMLPEEPLRPRLHLVASDEPARPAMPDLGIVLGVCVPFWAGVAWLLTAWL